MTPIKGILEPYFETGTEGVIWSVMPSGGTDVCNLHCLRNGDHLTIFDPLNNDIIIWSGNIDLEYERNYAPYHADSEYGQQAVHGMWVHGFQRDVTPEEWGLWFIKYYPAELIKRDVIPFPTGPKP